MKVEIVCQRCSKREQIHTEIDFSEAVAPSKLGIPLPGSRNGLTTYSVAHNDHTVVLDIDHNGDVRGEKIIDRLDNTAETLVASISGHILDLNLKADNYSLVFINSNRLLHNLLLGVFQQLMYNIQDEDEGSVSFSVNKCIFELGNFITYVGDWSEKMYQFAREHTTIVYELREDNVSTLQKIMIKDYASKNFTDFYLLFQTRFTQTQTGKEALFKLANCVPNLNMLEIGNIRNAAITLQNIVFRV